jgi:flagellar hook-associated protein 1
MSTLSIGVTGLNAAMVGLTTTSHNIANQATDGYNRQVIVQASNFPTLTGAGFVGQGTNVQTVKRIYDQFLNQQVLTAQTAASEMDSYYQQIKQIDNVLADTSSGLSTALSGFFSGVQSVAANPSLISSRQSMLSTASSLVSRFHSLNQRIAEIREGVNAQIGSEVSAISTYASQIADINQRILYAQAGSQTQQPNDLLDKRDQLIAELNQKVRVTTVTQSDGTMNVFFGNGQPLVVGTEKFSLTSVASNDDPERMVVVVRTPGGTTMQVPESQITGGSLGGLISFRANSLDSAQNALGRVAIALSQTFNAQHQLGQDLTGALGEDFFTVSDPTVYSNSLNGGSAVISAGFAADAASALTTSDYRLTYSAANTFTLTRLSDNTVWTGTGASAAAALADVLTVSGGEGLALSIASGAPAVGDSFTIEPTRSGAASIEVAISDARNIAAAAPMRTSAVLANTGTGSISAGSVNATPTTPNPTHLTTDANLQHQVTITFTSTGLFDVFDVTAGASLATNVAYSSATGADLDYNGWTVHVSGAPAAGDVFTVGPNTGGVSDNRNAVALAALQTAETMVGGTASYMDAYSQMVSEVGNKTSEVKTIGESQQALADSAVATQQAMSGVNLDEEAANLIRYQQAYQAAAKVIDISSKLFDQLLSLG